MLGFLLLISFKGHSALAQPDLQYRNRGDRYEGVKPKPVAGYDIELISVLVDYREEAKRMPNQLKIRFYLERHSEVYLTVRELDYRYYFWLDRVTPPRPWEPGFENIFQWPTKDVIQKLKGLRIYDLGVLARLGRRVPSSVERVAPAILYHSDAPELIMGYLFTFKINGDARVSCSVYKDGVSKPVWNQTFRRKLGGRPFTLRWKASGAEEGSYKLLVTGFFLDTSRRFHQSVHFFHQPNTR